MIKHVISLALFGLLTTSAYAAGGCCSGHGGVKQCGDDGYKYCADGTRSPSCKCEAPVPPAKTPSATKEAAVAVPAIALPPKPESKLAPLIGPAPKEGAK